MGTITLLHIGLCRSPAWALAFFVFALGNTVVWTIARPLPRAARHAVASLAIEIGRTEAASMSNMWPDATPRREAPGCGG